MLGVPMEPSPLSKISQEMIPYAAVELITQAWDDLSDCLTLNNGSYE